MSRAAKDTSELPLVGAVLRTLRSAVGLTAQQIAEAVGVHAKTWYRRELLGVLPRGDELERFCAAVDTRAPLRAKLELLAAAGYLTPDQVKRLRNVGGCS